MVAAEEELGKERLRKALKACQLQAKTGNYFLHERRKESWSWKMPEIRDAGEWQVLLGAEPYVQVWDEVAG